MAIFIALGVVLVAIVLLSIERIPIEVSSLAIVVLLVMSGLLSPREALAGFASETAIFIFALLALTQGLRATGVMQWLGHRLVFFARFGPGALTAVVLVAVCAFSSVSSNTAVTAAFLPVATASAVRSHVPPFRLLMPIAFSSMLGGTLSLFGTSTNLVVSAGLESMGLGGIGVVELTPVGLLLAGVGLLATVLLTRWFLRPNPGARNEPTLARSEDPTVTVTGSVEHQRPRHGRAPIAVLIFIGTVVVAGLRLTSPAIAGLLGLLCMIATGCVDARTAFRVDWRVVILIGALLSLGLAMEKSGAGEFLARRIIPLSGLIGPRGVLCVLMLTTMVLSIPMSNQAAALVMLPVSVHTALDLGLEPRTFALGICLAASCAFMTPLEPSAALVYGPGRYRFRDFLRVGTPLTLLMLVLLTVAVPVVWPFTMR